MVQVGWDAPGPSSVCRKLQLILCARHRARTGESLMVEDDIPSPSDGEGGRFRAFSTEHFRLRRLPKRRATTCTCRQQSCAKMRCGSGQTAQMMDGLFRLRRADAGFVPDLAFRGGTASHHDIGGGGVFFSVASLRDDLSTSTSLTRPPVSPVRLEGWEAAHLCLGRCQDGERMGGNTRRAGGARHLPGLRGHSSNGL